MSFKIGWFSTGKDKQAQDLLQKTWRAAKEGRIGPVEISYVFSNREWAEKKESDEFIKLCRQLKIPLICLSSSKFYPELRRKGLKEEKKGNPGLINQWRMLYDEKVIEMIGKCPVDIIFLAGYMLILGEEFCKKFYILNLHPAAPGGPKGTWQEVIWQLIEKRMKDTGIMIHKVTPELDAGPSITYCKFSLRGEKFDPLWKKIEEKLKNKSLKEIKREEGEKEPLFAAIREEQKKREIPFILNTLKLLAERKIDVYKIKNPVLIDNLEV